MDDNERDLFAEQLLEAGLAQAGRVQPPPGLDERVLARLEAMPSRSVVLGLVLRWVWRRAGRSVAAVLPALAMVVIAAVYLAHRRYPTRSSSPVVAAHQSAIGRAEPSRTKGGPPGRQESSLQPRLYAPAPLPAEGTPPQMIEKSPRQEQFPSPAALTEQELLLLSYLKRTPSPPPLAFHDPEQLKVDLQPKPLEPSRLEPPQDKTAGAGSE